MLAPSLMLATAAAPRVVGAEAAKGRPTIVVLPFEGDGQPVGDVATAAQLKAVGALRALGTVNLIHPKQLARVVERHESSLAELEPNARQDRLANWLGADWVVSGGIKGNAPKLGLSVRVRSVRGEGGSAVSLPPAGLIPALSKLPAALIRLLARSGVIARGSKTPAPALVAPATMDAKALLEYAGCFRLLMQQPIGIREPFLLDIRTVEEAIVMCEAASRLDPSFEATRAALGFAHAISGNQTLAERYLASVKDSKKFLPFYALGKFWILSRYDATDLALDLLRKMVAEHPGFLIGRGYLGDSLAALKRHDEALAVFETYLRAVPKQPWVMGRIGYAQARRGERDAAIESTKKALRLAPTDSELLLELASRLIDAGRDKEAITILKRIVADGGARGEVYLRLGYAYLRTGKLPAAERQFHIAIRRATRLSEWRTRGRARYDLAKLWMRQGVPDNALRQLRLAVKEGFRDRAAFSKDADLKPLAKSRKFASVLSAPTDTVAGRASYVSPFPIDPDAGTIALERIQRGAGQTISF